jgi:hypothetical protein
VYNIHTTRLWAGVNPWKVKSPGLILSQQKTERDETFIFYRSMHDGLLAPLFTREDGEALEFATVYTICGKA